MERARVRSTRRALTIAVSVAVGISVAAGLHAAIAGPPGAPAPIAEAALSGTVPPPDAESPGAPPASCAPGGPAASRPSPGQHRRLNRQHRRRAHRLARGPDPRAQPRRAASRCRADS
jgi:hypothetical protein